MTHTAENDPPLVEVCIRTRHPEDFVLVNERDGSRWRIVDGHWVASA